MLTLGDAADDDDVTRRAEELEVDIARKTNKSSERDPLLVIGNQWVVGPSKPWWMFAPWSRPSTSTSISTQNRTTPTTNKSTKSQ